MTGVETSRPKKAMQESGDLVMGRLRGRRRWASNQGPS
jgi:hypothetical protein